MKTFSLIWFISLLLLCCMRGISYAQTKNLQFEYLQQGLPKTGISSILQDQEGFMWFGTEDGLYKYDGHKATTYQADPANPDHTLRSNYIRAIHEDQKGRLWVATYGGGLHQVDKRTGKVIYPINSGQINEWNELYLFTIVEDEHGILWLGSSLGLVSFDPATEKYSLYPSPNREIIFSLKKDEHGILWAVNPEGMYRFDPTTGTFMLFPVTALSRSNHVDKKGNAWIGTWGEGLFHMDTHTPGQFTPYNPGGLIKNIIVDIYEADGLWLATSEGLQHIEVSTDQVTTYQSDPSQPGSLSSHIIWSVYKDRTGNLWVGTSNGVNKASTRTKPFYTHQIIPTPSSFHRPENEISAVLEDHTGTLWLSSAAKGLYRLDTQTHQLTYIVVNPDDKRTMLYSQEWPLIEDQQGQLWVGTDMEKGLYRLDRATGRFIRYACEIFIRMLDVDASGKLWIGGRYNEMASFDPATEQFTYYIASKKDSMSLIPGKINDLMVSRMGDVWAATENGISRLNPATGKFTRYQSNSKAPKGHLNDHYVLSLYEDQEGILWVGTHQGGLNRLDPHTNTFTYFTTQHGLPSNQIRSIIGDEKGNLWMGTSQGLSRFNPKMHTFRNFNISDGLPGNEFYGAGGVGSVFSRNGKLMFGNMDGLVTFYPDSIQENTILPPVYITGFTVMQQEREIPATHIELPYNENFLSFEFVALNYDAPEKNQYAYRLEGLDKAWVDSGTRKFASYTALAPGEYTFRVKASNNDGIWNEQGASLSLTILPPWWQTWWAYTIYALLGISILFGLVYYLVSRERLKNDLKLQRLEAEKMHEIDQMKSRFFANISHEFRTPLTLILGPLKALQEGTLTGDPKAVFAVMSRNAQRLLRLINQLLDFSKLEAGKMQLQTTTTDLVLLLRHITSAYESLATEKKIKYFFYAEVEELIMQLDQEKVATIMHNLLSNAFKFTAEGGEVILHLKTEGQWALVSVKDTGMGIAAEELDKVFDRFYQVDSSQTREQEGSGLGMALAKELTELHQGQIRVESQQAKGTTFTLWLPLGKASLHPEQIRETAEGKASEGYFVDQPLAKEIEEETTTPAAHDHPLILVVEDHADMRHYIRSILQSHYQVIEAANGKEGMQRAKALLPDLILSDVMMPYMDGYQLCEKIKTNELTSHIPLILLTAKADRQSKLTGLQTGADDYLAKPFDAEELLLIVRNHIEERRKMREHYSRQITLQPKAITITSVDEQFLQKVMLVIEAHMDDAAFGVEALSLEVGMSRMQLLRKLKALTDQAPNDFIRVIRLKRAAELLSQGAGNIAEVAFLVGFQDPSYFTKCFQKQFNQTPSDYIAARSL